MSRHGEGGDCGAHHADALAQASLGDRQQYHRGNEKPGEDVRNGQEGYDSDGGRAGEQDQSRCGPPHRKTAERSKRRNHDRPSRKRLR